VGQPQVGIDVQPHVGRKGGEVSAGPSSWCPVHQYLVSRGPHRRKPADEPVVAEQSGHAFGGVEGAGGSPELDQPALRTGRHFDSGRPFCPVDALLRRSHAVSVTTGCDRNPPACATGSVPECVAVQGSVMPRSRFGGLVMVLLVGALAAPGCAPDDPDAAAQATTPPGCADVIGARATLAEDGSYNFDVTVRSADTGWDKYADKWEVRAPDGSVLGERVLAHPHVEEQPFTRSQGGIRVPAELRTVTVVARDSAEGFCGRAFELELP